jgi:hypothetical protein
LSFSLCGGCFGRVVLVRPFRLFGAGVPLASFQFPGVGLNLNLLRFSYGGQLLQFGVIRLQFWTFLQLIPIQQATFSSDF